MNIVKISAKTGADYEPLASSDMFENLERRCYRGLIAYDNEEKAQGALIWKLVSQKHGETGEEIAFFKTESQEAARQLWDTHEVQIRREGVTSSFIEMEEMPKDIKDILSNAGFKLARTESRDLLLTMKEVRDAKIPGVSLTSDITSLKNLSEGGYWNATSLCVYHDMLGLVEDLEDLGMEWFDPDVSCCKFSDKWITGMFLLHQRPSGTLMPVLLFSGSQSKKILPQLLLFARNAALEKYDDCTKIIIRRHTTLTRELSSYLFPRKKGKLTVVGERKLKGRKDLF